MTHILVVDDHDGVRKLVCTLLQRSSNGSQIIISEAADGTAALNAWYDSLNSSDNPPITIIITDRHMPKMDGCQLVEHMRNKENNLIPIILHSTDLPNQEWLRTYQVIAVEKGDTGALLTEVTRLLQKAQNDDA